MRIEDLDGPRIKTGAATAALDILQWLGLDWDGPVLTQSDDLAPYINAMDGLARAGLAYPCDLSRTEIESAASAPQEGAGELRFPPELRPPFSRGPFSNANSSWRFVTPDRAIDVNDTFAGRHTFNPSRIVGDFILWTKRAQPSYQLAVVVDDLRQGVTDIIRGDDLLDSAARQTLLYQALGAPTVPAWWHLPLVVGEDGRRLAKRHGDTRISHYREQGVAPERVIALLARWCGIRRPNGDFPEHLSAVEFAQLMNVATIPQDRITFTQEHHAWLLRRPTRQ